MIQIPVSNVSWSSDELELPSSCNEPTEQHEATNKPASFSMSFDIPVTKAMRKEFREMTRIRPDLKCPHRKRAWRLVRKWFNRYQKSKMIGMTVVAQTVDGGNIPMVIQDVKIRKGCPGIEYGYTLSPLSLSL